MSNLNFLHSGGNKVTISAPASNPSSDVTFKLPQSDGSAGQVLRTDGNGNLSWYTIPTSTPGITMADQWRTYNTQSVGSNSASVVTSWERNDNTFAAIGSAMNESSGVFTFPTTGIYLVMYNFSFWLSSGNARYIAPRMLYNNVYMSHSFTHINHISTETFGNAGNQVMLDVTNTSHELKFNVVSNAAFNVVGNNWAGVGNENSNTSYVTFLRLGDT